MKLFIAMARGRSNTGFLVVLTAVYAVLTLAAASPPRVTGAGKHLAPLPFHREAVATVARNVVALRRAIPGVPVLLENIAYTLALPGSVMSEAEFRVRESRRGGVHRRGGLSREPSREALDLSRR